MIGLIYLFTLTQATNDIKRQELFDAEQIKLQQMQLDHDNIVSNLREDINRLREELQKSQEETLN